MKTIRGSQEETICNWFLEELAKAEYLHPKWPKDEIHAAAIVGEEAGELIRASLQNTYGGGKVSAMRKEAIQTGAMAIRFLKNLLNRKEP
jgi:hypothetical protein